MDPVRGDLVAEGKTKNIYANQVDQTTVIISNKDAITAFDDPSYTKRFGTKAAYATATTCRVFELLQAAGIPVAYRRQLSETEFLADRCQMIPLEVVARRFAVGSYLKRHPELKAGDGVLPHRFSRLCVEFFLKTTGGKLELPDGQVVIDGLDAQKGEEDPFIANPFESGWRLVHPKRPEWENGSLIKQVKGLPQTLKLDLNGVNPGMMEGLMRKVFLTLEGGWNSLGYRLIDMKIEFGLDAEGKLRVADVIDNDSWRLRTADWRELSKQAFRDGESLDEVERKYGTVARLAEGLRMPKQALVLWRGSASDELPFSGTSGEKDHLGGYWFEQVTCSGHKSPRRCLATLDRLVSSYPDGGVIIAFVGRSNGLGPMLAASSPWPVIAVPVTAAEHPEDVWSSLRMPSKVPLATAWPSSNAVLLALRILSRNNPHIYMNQQLQTEKLDM